jgi:hypothetical protein
MLITTYLWYLMVILGIFYGIRYATFPPSNGAQKITPSSETAQFHWSVGGGIYLYHLISTIEIRYISILYNPNSVMRYNQSYEPYKSLLIHNTFPNTFHAEPLTMSCNAQIAELRCLLSGVHGNHRNVVKTGCNVNSIPQSSPFL